MMQILLFVIFPFICSSQAIAHYLYNVSFNLQITAIRSSHLDSCLQFVSPSNIVSSINNIFYSELVSNPLFNIFATPESNVVSCFEDELVDVLLETNAVVLSTENDTGAVTNFYTNSLNAIQTSYPQYTLAYTHQNIKIEVYEYTPSTTSSFNSSNFYTTNGDDIPSFLTSENNIKSYEIWKPQWWKEWHGWKIFGVAVFGVMVAVTCLGSIVICYKWCCCCCKSKHSNKHEKIPTEDPDLDEKNNQSNDKKNDEIDEKKVDKDGPVLPENKLYHKVLSDHETTSVTGTNVIEEVLPSHKQQHNYHSIPLNHNSESESDIEEIYENPKKPTTTRGTSKKILTFLSNHNQHKSDVQMGVVEPKIYLDSDSNRARNDSMSVPPIPPSPGDGFEGNIPCLMNENKAGSSHKYDIKSRASKELITVNYVEENKYNEYVGSQNSAKFSNYKPVGSHSRCSSKVSLQMSCGDSVGSNEMYKRQTHNEIRINMDDEKHKELMDWFMKDVCLRNEHTVDYFNVFVGNGFDTIESVSDMRYDDLEAIGINKLGHKKTLMQAIGKLKLAPPVSSPPTHKYCSSSSSVTHEYQSQLNGINESNFNNQSLFSQNS